MNVHSASPAAESTNGSAEPTPVQDDQSVNKPVTQQNEKFKQVSLGKQQEQQEQEKPKEADVKSKGMYSNYFACYCFYFVVGT